MISKIPHIELSDVVQASFTFDAEACAFWGKETWSKALSGMHLGVDLDQIKPEVFLYYNKCDCTNTTKETKCAIL